MPRVRVRYSSVPFLPFDRLELPSENWREKKAPIESAAALTLITNFGKERKFEEEGKSIRKCNVACVSHGSARRARESHAFATEQIGKEIRRR